MHAVSIENVLRELLELCDDETLLPDEQFLVEKINLRMAAEVTKLSDEDIARLREIHDKYQEEF